MTLSVRVARLPERVQETLTGIVAGAKLWYPRYEAALPEDLRLAVTRVGCLKPSTIGTQDVPQLHLKAAESRQLLPFILTLVR